MHEEAEPNTILVTESVYTRLGETFEFERGTTSRWTAPFRRGPGPSDPSVARRSVRSLPRAQVCDRHVAEHQQLARLLGRQPDRRLPLLVILLGETIDRLERRHSPLAAPLRLLRTFVLPVLAFELLLLRRLFGVQRGAPFRPGDRHGSADRDRRDHAVGDQRDPHPAGRRGRRLGRASPPSSSSSRDSRSSPSRSRWRCRGSGTVNLSGAVTALGIGSRSCSRWRCQEPLSNLFSGVLLIFDRPIRRRRLAAQRRHRRRGDRNQLA